MTEIILAIAIISIIAAMLIPSFVVARQKTRRAICLTNLRLLMGCAERYCIEEKVSDNIQISQDNLIDTDYIEKKAKCPAGNIEYGAFIIRDRPACPNIGSFPDHKLED